MKKELPLYKCLKEVRALRILAVIELEDSSGASLVVEAPFDNIEVDQAYLEKHKPQPDGYYVVYEDGYQSWSPAKAFEEGYELIE